MADLQIGSVFAGYRIEAIAARGGMGVIYRAVQISPERTVALKVIAPGLAQDPDYRKRFQRESEIAASIEHPNVIPIYDAGEHDGVLFIAMRWVEGTTLASLLAEQGRLHPVRTSELVGQVAAALDAAHARGLVHRDVKPANVLLDQQGSREHVYLTDFGVARRLDTQTITGGVGTIDYMAPEQLTGDQLDPRTDVYGLGCLLYRMLTGEVPYPADNDLAKMRAHVEAPVPKPSKVAPELSPAFDTVIARALAKEPERRFATAGELAQAAEDAARGLAPITAETRLAPPAPPPTAAAATAVPPPAVAAGGRWGRGILVALGALVAVAAGAIIAIVAIGGSGNSNDGGGGVTPPPPARAPGARPSTQSTATTPSTATSPSGTTGPASPPASAPCSVTDDSGRNWMITIGTPNTTDCGEAQQVWTQYQRKVGKNGFQFQNIGQWNCRPGHCYKRVPPDPRYAAFDATPG